MTQADRGKRNAEMIRLYKDGLSYQEIGERFGMSKQNVQQTLVRYGVQSRSPGRARSESIKFSDYASLIAEKRKAGIGIIEIAKTFGLYPTHRQWDEFREFCKQFPRFGGLRHCKICGFTGDPSHFFSRDTYCKKCRLEYNRKKRSEWTPERRAKWNAYVNDWQKKHSGLGKNGKGMLSESDSNTDFAS